MIDESVHRLWLQTGRPKENIIYMAASIHEMPTARELGVSTPGSSRTEDTETVLRNDDVDQSHVANYTVLDYLTSFDKFTFAMALVSDND